MKLITSRTPVEILSSNTSFEKRSKSVGDVIPSRINFARTHAPEILLFAERQDRCNQGVHFSVHLHLLRLHLPARIAGVPVRGTGSAPHGDEGFRGRKAKLLELECKEFKRQADAEEADAEEDEQASEEQPQQQQEAAAQSKKEKCE